MKQSNKQNGFTLIEVAIASLLMSLLIISVLSLQQENLINARKNYFLSIAYIQAYSFLDLLRTNDSSSNKIFYVWRQTAKNLLPESEAKYRCVHQDCEIELSWYYHDKNKIKLSSRI